MRSKERLLFLIMALLSFCIHPPASSLVHSKENGKEKVVGEDFINNKYDQGSGTQNKLAHGTNAGGGNGGQPAVAGGDGGGSHTPYVQGGGGVTPLYAAGAGNNHHNHHGGGNRDDSRAGVATLVIAIFACFLLCINKDW